eukprot:5636000-Alexandrium_andersonii.AAC.1
MQKQTAHVAAPSAQCELSRCPTQTSTWRSAAESRCSPANCNSAGDDHGSQRPAKSAREAGRARARVGRDRARGRPRDGHKGKCPGGQKEL